MSRHATLPGSSDPRTWSLEDEQGRAATGYPPGTALPRRLRELSGIEDEIVVIGMYDRMEVWSLEEWNSYLARMEEKYETSLNKILNVL